MPMDLARLNFNGRLIFVSPRDSLPGTRQITDPTWLAANARTIATSMAQTTETRWFGANVAHFTQAERIDWLEDNIILNGRLGSLGVFADDPSQQPASTVATKRKKQTSK